VPLSKTFPVQVRFGDLDVFGHVNNVAYFALMETARVEYLRTVARTLPGHVVVARSECDHVKEIRGGTRVVDVEVSAEKVGTSSVVLVHHLRVGEELMAVGRVVLVALDAERKPRPVTDEERASLLS
jgi:acyl-CoA thioester hydrolase